MMSRSWSQFFGAISLVVLASPTVGRAQDLKPPKNAANIIVQTADSPVVAYRTIARLLLTRGYGLQTSDATLLSVTTTFRDADGAGPVQISAFVLEDSAGTVIQLTGVWKFTMGNVVLQGSGDAPQPISYGGSGGSPKRKAWDSLNAVAVAYPGGTVLYVDPKTGKATPGNTN